MQNFQTARQAYRQTDIVTRAQAANAHGLVDMLFQELVATLHRAEFTTAAHQMAQRSAATSRAISILHGLRTSLDVKSGGALAENLDALYAHSLGQLVAAQSKSDTAAIASVRQNMTGIAEAWATIGPRA
jgi:flagellar secretion chaperone FliS